MPIQTSSSPPGFRAEEFYQIPCPFGETIRTTLPFNTNIQINFTHKNQLFGLPTVRPSFKVCCILVQLAPLGQLVVYILWGYVL